MWGRMVSQIALLVWMITGFMFFATMRPLRAFALTYVLGILLLPVEVGDGGMGSIVVTQSLRLDKFTACHLAALLGTLVFAPQVLGRYRFGMIDAAFGLVVAAIAATSLANGYGVKDAASNAFNTLRVYGPLLLLSKAYIVEVDDLLVCLRTMIGGAVLYALIAAGEFRFSPQLHRYAYGYFQHGFDQFARYDHFRPAGMLRHAIEFSFFMGTSCLAALWLTLRRMFPPLWGVLPGWAVTGILAVGLACTLTYSGYAALLAGAGFMVAIILVPNRWWLAILPLAALLWIGLRYSGAVDGQIVIDMANHFDEARAESVQYRILTENLHLDISRQHFLFGLGPVLGFVRTQEGSLVRAVDAFWLIQIVCYGAVGLGAWLAFWCGGIGAAWRIWSKADGGHRTVAALIAIILGLSLVDFLFNSFPSHFLFLLNAGLASVAMRRPQVKPVETPGRPRFRSKPLVPPSMRESTGWMG